MVKRYKYTPQRMRESTQGTYVQLSDYEDIQQELDHTDLHLNQMIEQVRMYAYALDQKQRQLTIMWIGYILIGLANLLTFII